MCSIGCCYRHYKSHHLYSEGFTSSVVIIIVMCPFIVISFQLVLLYVIVFGLLKWCYIKIEKRDIV